MKQINAGSTLSLPAESIELCPDIKGNYGIFK